jgi:hypothetical protein
MNRRVAVALVLALGALVAAAIAAIGPAVTEGAVYTWPPARLPAEKPTRTWFAPLLVARQSVESFDAAIPCGEPSATLADAGRNVVLLATARDAGSNDAIGVTWSRRTGATSVRIGRTVVVAVSAGRASPCRLDLQLRGSSWSVRLPDGTSHRGTLESPPRIFGLVTELDLAAKPALAATVQPYAQDTDPSTRQTLLRLLTAAMLAVAVTLVFCPWRWKWARILRYPAWRPSAQDGVVLGLAGVWWLLAPLQVDDGWVRGRQVNSLFSGGFSNYYDDFGANLPLATWYEWVQHFVMTRTDWLAVHRLFPLTFVVATWFVTRWCLVELTGRRPNRSDTAWWVSAAVFAIGATAFGMTLRPEPTIALLVVAVLACCIRYLRSSGIGPLVVAVFLVGLSLTIHPAGAVALAPLLVCLPRMIGDARRQRGITVVELGLAVFLGAAWTTLLALLDFDLSSRDESIRLLQRTGHSAGVVQEPDRYELLWQWGASPLRRELVAFLLISSVVGLAAWIRSRDLLERLPSASIAIGLLLLAFAPSKWIWHFGAFTGLAVVAIGLESDRFDRGHLSAHARWIAAAALLAVSLFVTGDVEAWGPLDGSGVKWDSIPYLPLTGATALVALLLTRLRRRGSLRKPEAVVVISVAAALIGTTTAALATAAASSNEWTAARQVLSPVTGSDTCGVTDGVQIPDARSLNRLEPWPSRATARSEQRAIVSTSGPRWYRLPHETIGVFVSGVWDHKRLVVTWGRSNGKRPHVLASADADLGRAQTGAIPASWWLVSERSFPARPPDADVVRISVVGEPSTSTARTSQPFSYESRELSDLVERAELKTLSSPYLFEALPCATLPRLELGVAEPPKLLLDGGPPPLTIATSPFLGITDMFTIWKAPVEPRSGRDLPYPWEKVTAYWVGRDPRDAIAPAVRERHE